MKDHMRRTLMLTLCLGLLAGACTSGGDPSPSPSGTGPSFNGEVASADLYVDAPQRFLIGLLAGDANGVRYVSYGSVKLAFAFLGDGSAAPAAGPTATATYVGAPGTNTDGTAPTLTQPSEARGVYQAEDVTFDQVGTWQVTATADVEGAGALTGDVGVPRRRRARAPRPRPAGAQDATTSRCASKDEPLGGDRFPCRARADRFRTRICIGGRSPTRSRRARPALVAFATPVYCTSQFCGPVVDAVEKLSQRYADRAVFIHMEIYHDFTANEINQAAADWLYRNGDLREPWLYLIGADGKIVDRWGVLWNPDEVGAELRALPPMG